MRIPRDWSGEDLIKRLRPFGYEPTRQSGSHVRLTCRTEDREHHVTIPLHKALRVGTLSSILSEVATHLEMNKEALLRKMQ